MELKEAFNIINDVCYKNQEKTCENSNEVVNAFKSFKELVDLQEDFGGSLVVILNLIKNSNTLDEHCHTQDIWFDYKGKLISGSFATLKYNNNEFIIEVETYDMFDSKYDCDSYELNVKDYKKTWWFKEDKTE